MNKTQQMNSMKIAIKKLFDDGFSDEYIVARAWGFRLSDISINDIENILKDLHIEKQIVTQ